MEMLRIRPAWGQPEDVTVAECRPSTLRVVGPDDPDEDDYWAARVWRRGGVNEKG